MNTIKRTYASSSGAGNYTTVVRDDGRVSCDCRGWCVKKPGQPRECKHTRNLVSELRLRTVVRGDYLFSVSGASVTRPTGPVAPPSMGTSTSTRPTGPVASKVATQAAALSGVLPLPMPMLASPLPDGRSITDYENADWVMEEKLDGHRVVVRVSHRVVPHVGATHDVVAWSRPRAGADALRRELPPHIIEAMEALPSGDYDGELIVPGGTAPDVARTLNFAKLIFVIFDLLSFEGRSLMNEPWHTRRTRIDNAIVGITKSTGPGVRVIDVTPVSKWRLDSIWRQGGEGAIVKRASGQYWPGMRSTDWIKFKAVRTAPLTIIGFEAGKLGPHSVVKLRDADGIETTVKVLDNATLADVERNPSAYIGRTLRIEFQERTADRKYRHPRWDHVE
jgi:ATP-dependent DNA ligase